MQTETRALSRGRSRAYHGDDQYEDEADGDDDSDSVDGGWGVDCYLVAILVPTCRGWVNELGESI